MITNIWHTKYKDLNKIEKKFIQYITPIVNENTLEFHEFEELVNEFLSENKEQIMKTPSKLIMLNGILFGVNTIIIAHEAVSTGNYCPILKVYFKK